MKEIAFEYRCRRCSKIERNPHTAEVNGAAVLAAVVNDSPMPIWGATPKLVDFHTCPDKGMGITDLIGYSIKD